MRLRTSGYPTTDPFGLFDQVQMVYDVDSLTKDDCLLLWGGKDISPHYYGETPNKKVNTTINDRQDQQEWAMIQRATRLDIPIIGICRGLQWLTIAAGGKLMQHADGHGTSHYMIIKETGEQMYVNSAHHQLCLVEEPGIVLATDPTPVQCLDGNNKPVTLPFVVEAAYFPHIRGFGVQYHPEWSSCPDRAVAWAAEQIKKYLLEK